MHRATEARTYRIIRLRSCERKDDFCQQYYNVFCTYTTEFMG